ncbi:MAG: UDP-2,3-diacylglucosamine diphosphatase LpxI [Nitrospirae bacterium]|nr:UDP-2,3-diacylglucosamine diphosphatase LpxI [Nitrospirota bacterium]
MPLKASRHTDSQMTLGLIAGMGGLPRIVAEEAKKKGYRVAAFALQPPSDNTIREYADDFHKVNIGHLGKLISLMKKLSVTEAVMAGKVPKSLLYQNKMKLIPDARGAKVLFSLEDRSDDTIMTAIVNELEKEGIKILTTTSFAGENTVPQGVLTKKKPSKEEYADIEFGWLIAKKIGQLDIGQTVVVKKRAVMAIEAIEGTDEAIKRGGSLAGKDAVVIKVSKPNQDMRFDVPVIGIETLHSMRDSKAGVLAVEADKTIIIDIDEFIKEADRAGISVVGISL